MVKIWENESAQWRVALTEGPALSVDTGETGRELLIGLGEAPDGEVLRRAAAKAVKTVRSLGGESAVLDAAPAVARLGPEGAGALALGGALAQYRPTSWKKSHEAPFALYLTGVEGCGPALDEAAVLADCVCMARDLVNCPSNILTPQELAARAVQAATAAGIETEVLDEQAARALGMGALLTVGDSSVHPPRLIVLRYRGGPADQAPIALVGKGVCCDTGGYCLKTRTSLKHTYGDMAGAAAVCAAVVALATNRVPVNATAVIPAVENRISAGSFLPGDVITSLSGRTIEIGNTDAEGRLILADAVTWAVEREHAAQVVDIATLTGAMAGALGGVATGYLCNDGALDAALLRAAGRSGERFWRFPTFPEYRAMIDSPVADLYNHSDGCSAICAGLFVGEFAGEVPWLHLDIAGTAATASPLREYQVRGATGVGVTTLYELCKGYGYAG